MSSLPVPLAKRQRVQTPSRGPQRTNQVAIPAEIVHTVARQPPSQRQNEAKTAVARRLNFDDL